MGFLSTLTSAQVQAIAAALTPAATPTDSSDKVAPKLTVFRIPAKSASLTVPITALKATDKVGVTGYMVNESSATPLAEAEGWSSEAPDSYTFESEGKKKLYAWAKDAAGNVSNSHNDSVEAGDSVAPKITVFRIPAKSASLTVPITALKATDKVGVTGYMVNESSATPLAETEGWSSEAPDSYTFESEGKKKLYAWAKDAAENVSNARNDSVTIKLPGSEEGDMVAPKITVFRIPAKSSSLTVSITSLVATDKVGVTGYMVNESASQPSVASDGWSSTAPASYTFEAEGKKKLYAWAKDAAGNVSNARNDGVTIKVPVDGAALYDTNCAACHGALASSSKKGRTAAQTQSAINNNIGGMGYLSALTSEQVKAIANALSSAKKASGLADLLTVKQKVFVFDPVASPMQGSRRATAKPIGVGPVASGGDTFDLNVKLDKFSRPVDVYIGLYGLSASITPQDISDYNTTQDGLLWSNTLVLQDDMAFADLPSGPYVLLDINLLKSANQLQPQQEEITPWLSGVTEIDETILSSVPVSLLPSGPYVILLGVTRNDDGDKYYLWETYFIVP